MQPINQFGRPYCMKKATSPLLGFYRHLSGSTAKSKTVHYLKAFNGAYNKASPTIAKVLRATGIFSMLIPVGTLIYAYSVQLTPKDKEFDFPPLLNDIRNDYTAYKEKEPKT